MRKVEDVTGERALPPGWGIKQLRAAIDAAGVALWAWNVDSDRLTMDDRAFELWGLPHSDLVTFEELSSHIHPRDRERVREAFAATRAVVGSYETDFRIVIGEEVRWISARGQGNDEDLANRVMFGVFLDVTGRKQAEEGHELLAGEMSHRVKNLLAIASGLAAMTSRSSMTVAEMANDLTRRLTALGRAHDLVRPLVGADGKAALLGDLFTVLLAPYDDLGAFGGRIRVAVPRMGVGERAVTTLALVVHELATNSLKYGALSSSSGTVNIECADEEADTVVIWTEHGGPSVTEPDGTQGFGSKLITRSMSALGGSIAYDWAAAGVITTLRMRRDRLAN